jgi:hypothetical protein
MMGKLNISVILVMTMVFLTLAACGAQTTTPSSSTENFLLPMATEAGSFLNCEGCAQATLVALQTQEKNSADAQAAGTAEIMRSDAQSTLNAVSSTLSAALTQEQDKANVIAAQVAATAQLDRANAQATLVAAGSTQSVALTQDAIRQTQVQSNLLVTIDLATRIAQSTLTQQNNNFLASGTQTSVANNIATQTQSALATTQWYADQARQRDEQRQGPLTFLWLWCLPLFIISIALICTVFFWRWMKIRETQQLIDMQSQDVIIQPAPPAISAAANNQYQISKPADHVRGWMEEVKNKLLASKKDDDDNADS